MSGLKKYLSLYLLVLLVVSGCNSDHLMDRSKSDPRKTSADRTANRSDSPSGSETQLVQDEDPRKIKGSERKAENEQPLDVREFFMLMPDDMFAIESCEEDKDKLCRRAKAAYLKRYKTVEDIKNGYLEAGGDGAQSSFKMAIFKRPDKSYLVGLHVLGETENSYSFHDYSEGRWEDISIEVVPEYSTSNIYEIPRFGTKVAVFAKRIIEQSQDFEVSEKGEKLYDLKWEKGEFSIER